MASIKQARELLEKGDYKQAAEAIDELLRAKKDDDRLWYMRAVAAIKLKSYDSAQECLLQAIILKDRPEYRRLKGMAYLEIFELENAIEEFKKAIKLKPADAGTHFFLFLAYAMMDDPRAADHLRQALKLDPKAARELLENTYSIFVENDPHLSAAQKNKISQLMKKAAA